MLVIDDVVTTGATLRTAAEALRGAGVARVELVAAASAQLRHSVAPHRDFVAGGRGLAKASAVPAGRL